MAVQHCCKIQLDLVVLHLTLQLAAAGKASTLYLATCRLSGLTVVLKAYSKRRLSNLNWYQVDREIRLHSGLQHEHVIALHGAFEDKEHVYMVQEHAAGGARANTVGWGTHAFPMLGGAREVGLVVDGHL
jgi:hypothetical protein